jgi:hypothetical protein
MALTQESSPIAAKSSTIQQRSTLAEAIVSAKSRFTDQVRLGVITKTKFK